MLFFRGLNGPRFLWALIEAVAVWLTIASGLSFIWSQWEIQQPELVWAVTVATGLIVFYIGILICFTRQQVLETRINECAAAKAELEEAVLKNRLSSRKKKR